VQDIFQDNAVTCLSCSWWDI